MRKNTAVAQKPTHPDIYALCSQLSSGGKMWLKWCRRGILAFVVIADGLVCRGSLKTTIRTPLKEAILYQMCAFNWDNFTRLKSCILISADETRFLSHISFTLCPLFNSCFISMGQKKKEPPRSVSWVYKDRFKWQRGVNCVLKFHNKLVEYFPTWNSIEDLWPVFHC